MHLNIRQNIRTKYNDNKIYIKKKKNSKTKLMKNTHILVNI